MSSFEVISQSELPMKSYKLVRDNKRNQIYHDKSSQKYLKLFNTPLDKEHSTFLFNLFHIPWFRKTFTPHLTNLVVKYDINRKEAVNKNICGYIMNAGKTLDRNELIAHFRSHRNQSCWKKSMKKFNFYYNDFKTNNLIKTSENGKKVIGLIDLEAIRPITGSQHHTEYSARNLSNIKRKIELFQLKWYYDYLYKLQDKPH